jgi:hypothetical protein
LLAVLVAALPLQQRGCVCGGVGVGGFPMSLLFPMLSGRYAVLFCSLVVVACQGGRALHRGAGLPAMWRASCCALALRLLAGGLSWSLQFVGRTLAFGGLTVTFAAIHSIPWQAAYAAPPSSKKPWQECYKLPPWPPGRGEAVWRRAWATCQRPHEAQL